VRERQAGARSEFEGARDAVAQLGPPAAARKSLPEDWEQLVAWAQGKRAELDAELKKAEAESAGIKGRRAKIVDLLLDACRECELDVTDETRVLESVVAAHTSAEHEVKTIESALATSRKLEKKVKTLDLERATAHELSLHLSAKPGRFESWIVNAALRRLVEGATEILDELSNGQYALTTDESGNFLVVDRHNADEQRSARTLSGGETFLASLSLALALADQLADLASEGAARLDAIFLDEGFGTLDSETLDTVAATVENLAAGGRMVGIVTHVRELADRVPLQFRVRKDLKTSSIEKVVA
jgi:exonuclease SbcC